MLGVQSILFLLGNNPLLLVLNFDELSTASSICSILVAFLNDPVLALLNM